MTGGPLFVSSGDVTADQHYGSALQRAARGDLAGAAEILAQTVQVAPAFATAWFALGAIRDSLGDRAGAITAWLAARDADPDDYHGARLQLARLGVGENTPAMTAAYVRRLFDQQAASFDEALLQRLDYRGPEVVLDAVRSVAGMELRIGSMLDLGCGTGLGGAAFRPYADWLVGVDISPGMVAKAREKGFYDRLAVLDLQHFLHAEVQSRAQYHLSSRPTFLSTSAILFRSRLPPPVCSHRTVSLPSRSRSSPATASCCSRPCATPTARHMSARR